MSDPKQGSESAAKSGAAAAKQKKELWDVLVVGGGPGGTAAAFRARELGLSALVLEFDDLMKRIRDYSKSKLILPGFGGGDKIKFPNGGSLISSLRFEPIDKDDMCHHWKELYRSNRIPNRIGFELTGLQKRSDGYLKVFCWDHNGRKQEAFYTRHLVLALGNGVPRRFDIPGNTEGVCFQLRDPDDYVGFPACVIGGGTSAAEAVIAISNAKARAGDPTSVYWSYRGDRLPRVSKALAEVFFEAYAGNGNIRYYPKSEPAAIVTAEDHREYLAIRIDRRRMDDRPVETSHLEFLKQHCLACIGEDLPEALLASMGIHLVTGGPRNKKRVVVNRYLETRVPNVYLVGDILSQAYLQADDFDADPAGFEEIKHRGNIKSALRDGVLVAEIIKQRIDGKSEINVEIEDMPDDMTIRPSHEALVTPAVAARVARESGRMTTVQRDTSNEACLFRIFPNGIVETEHPLPDEGTTSIGRTKADIEFPDDEAMESPHASIIREGDRFTLCDDSGSSGVFLAVPSDRKTTLKVDDLLRAGRQFLLVGGEGDRYWLTHFDFAGRQVGIHPLSAKSLVLGRAGGDIVLDKEDLSLSRRHMAISAVDGHIQIKDLKSANHTFLRLRDRTILRHGDQFQIGSQLLTFGAPGESVPNPYDEPVRATGKMAVITEAAAAAASSGSAVPDAPTDVLSVLSDEDGGAPTVTFVGTGKTVAVQPGQTLLEVAESQGFPINAECRVGICGSDPIQIVEGRENLVAEPTPGECETLEDLCDLEPGPCRLACMAKIKGPVKVKILNV
ncbi:FAD-dependent oxidoreductase [Sulfidibacter corallicola]|uniref:FAD-dependent oxidoreductase n=1 Tax=Sulfidibacter corallicola TaxID=2818388 RepID=A0A8A4TN52_SULCO|nr:FAD-dependent oxidoreductase [Sulfidibacter corallicola]QTD51419.1 FAD-dependent oxidoreductase [Sulfidibacter corallicola]